ncbi:MAG: T9SS type A sorting domain-containing protein [Candidatus Poribacteria bacterium]|nr:T9SS type A sorting domain-containing protein [Candidatus Poribacteria bacterium]
MRLGKGEANEIAYSPDGTKLAVASDIDIWIYDQRGSVEKWLKEAQQLNLSEPAFQRGILVLEQLLAAFTPKETALLPNYPNPFNPETWIPYQLATPADVHISIYTADGKLVRQLGLGHLPVGIYHHRSRAAHWDGKNALGEPVASGVYFYTFSAGQFTATRKMLIRK